MRKNLQNLEGLLVLSLRIHWMQRILEKKIY
uniref:Uncharacterized protein n=1 Tax=Arundo donax TaxID=35708 RepID=A0A0A9ICT4_ARUDO